METESTFGAVKLLVDGVDVIRDGTKEQRRKPTAKTDKGKRVSIRLGSLFDPFSKLRVDGDVVRMSPPLRWYQRLVTLWPFFFGLISNLVVSQSIEIPFSTSITAGLLSVFYGTRALRARKTVGAGIVFALLISVAAVAASVLFSAAVASLF